MTELAGKVAIVTGASSGIGKAIAVTLIDAGCKVAGLARRVERIEELSKSLQGKKGTLVALKCDVTSEEEVKNAFASILQQLGPPHILINNAGVMKLGVFTGFRPTEMRRMLETNVIGLSVCTREAIALMTEHAIPGSIVNINSVSGHTVVPIPGLSPYNATKYSVTALTEALRNELSLMQTPIRVTSISPGLVVSEMTDQFKGALEENTPMLESEDIANLVLFIVKTPPTVNITELSVRHVSESGATVALRIADMVKKMKS